MLFVDVREYLVLRVFSLERSHSKHWCAEKMPRKKQLIKYKCCEPACGIFVRADKWANHCQKEHGWKFARGEVISKTTCPPCPSTQSVCDHHDSSLTPLSACTLMYVNITSWNYSL